MSGGDHVELLEQEQALGGYPHLDQRAEHDHGTAQIRVHVGLVELERIGALQSGPAAVAALCRVEEHADERVGRVGRRLVTNERVGHVGRLGRDAHLAQHEDAHGVGERREEAHHRQRHCPPPQEKHSSQQQTTTITLYKENQTT